MKYSVKIIALAIVILIAAIGCDNQESKQEPFPEFGTVQVGTMPVLGAAPTFFAFEKGYFVDEGLQVELQSFNSASYMIPLLATGDLDVGVGQPGTELFNAIHQGLDIKIAFPAGTQVKGYDSNPFLVRKDLIDSGEISEIADLKGKTIAVNVERGLVEFIIASILARGNLTLEDVNLITMPFPEMNVAFANKAIDAAVVPQPLAEAAVKAGNAVILIQVSDVFDRPTIGFWFFGKRLLEANNQEIGIRFIKAYLRAARELMGENGYSDENVEILSKYTNVPTTTIKSGVKNYFDPNGEMSTSFIEEIMTYYVNQGYTEFNEPINIDDVFDFSYLNAAIEQIGRYEE